MKILRESKTWVLEHECSGWGSSEQGCKAVLGLDREDLFYDFKQNRVLFICPLCHTTTTLGLNDRPHDYDLLTPWII